MRCKWKDDLRGSVVTAIVPSLVCRSSALPANSSSGLLLEVLEMDGDVMQLEICPFWQVVMSS